MNKPILRIASLVCVVMLAPAWAQDEPRQEDAKFRSDAEILAGLEVYAANLDAAYVQMREERDALKARVEELERELEALKE